MTVDEWADMDEDDPGELVDGRLVEEEVPNLLHESLVAYLVRKLGDWVCPRGGFAFGSEGKYAVSPRGGRKPDVAVFFPGRAVPPIGVVRVPPDVCVEIVSRRPRDARRDRIDKLREYALFGVHYYWIVDPALRTIEIFELGADGRYAHALALTNGRADNVPGLAGFVLDAGELWAELDRLQASTR